MKAAISMEKYLEGATEADLDKAFTAAQAETPETREMLALEVIETVRTRLGKMQLRTLLTAAAEIMQRSRLEPPLINEEPQGE